MKTKELRQKTSQEIELLLKEHREKLRRLRFDLSEKKLKNVKEISSNKKTIARVLTILEQRHEQK